MKIEQKLGMLEVTEIPESKMREIANKYSITAPTHNGGTEIHRFAWVHKGALYVPLPCIRSYSAHAPKRIEYPDPVESATLREYQESALTEWLASPYGLLCASAGSGKTHVGCALIGARKVRSVVIVPTIDIARQWEKRLKDTLNVYAGIINGHSRRMGEQVTISTYQSALRTPELLSKAGLVLVDEAHRTPCRSIRDILAVCPAPYRYGCTATPWRADGLHGAFEWLLGGVTARVSRKATEGHILTGKVLQIETGLTFETCGDHNALQAWVAEDAKRNEMIAGRIESLVGAGHKVIALGQRLDQLDALSETLGYPWCCITGGTNKGTREQYIADVKRGAYDVLLATYQLAAEGLDIPNLSALVMCAPIGNPTKVEQAVGRIARPCKGKLSPVVIDFVDDGGMVRALSRKREIVYDRMKWRIG